MRDPQQELDDLAAVGLRNNLSVPCQSLFSESTPKSILNLFAQSKNKRKVIQ